MILAQALGRWGNYFNQELYGGPTDVAWGIPISFINRMPGFETFEFFHPTFLYQSLLNFSIFIILILWHIIRLRNKEKKPPNYGSIFLAYLVLYSIARGAMELVRIDQSPVIMGFRLQFLLSVLIIVFAIVMYAYMRKRKKKI